MADEWTWFGITCMGGVVTSIQLTGNSLAGDVPIDIAELAG